MKIYAFYITIGALSKTIGDFMDSVFRVLDQALFSVVAFAPFLLLFAPIFVLIILNAVIASQKQRSVFASVVCSIVLTPIIPYLYLLAVPKREFVNYVEGEGENEGEPIVIPNNINDIQYNEENRNEERRKNKWKKPLIIIAAILIALIIAFKILFTLDINNGTNLFTVKIYKNNLFK
ncbi:MAG: hypothetical protein LBV16_05005 [Elusimicrobiota bacterium]|nr:hypothetical protein [Elusimicrobiota bacterium]